MCPSSKTQLSGKRQGHLEPHTCPHAHLTHTWACTPTQPHGPELSACSRSPAHPHAHPHTHMLTHTHLRFLHAHCTQQPWCSVRPAPLFLGAAPWTVHPGGPHSCPQSLEGLRSPLHASQGPQASPLPRSAERGRGARSGGALGCGKGPPLCLLPEPWNALTTGPSLIPAWGPMGQLGLLEQGSQGQQGWAGGHRPETKAVRRAPRRPGQGW